MTGLVLGTPVVRHTMQKRTLYDFRQEFNGTLLWSNTANRHSQRGTFLVRPIVDRGIVVDEVVHIGAHRLPYLCT